MDNFSGIWVSAELLEIEELTLSEKIMTAYIIGLSQKEGFCMARNRHLADHLGITERSVTNLIASLTSKQYISTETVEDNRVLFASEKLFRAVFLWGDQDVTCIRVPNLAAKKMLATMLLNFRKGVETSSMGGRNIFYGGWKHLLPWVETSSTPPIYIRTENKEQNKNKSFERIAFSIFWDGYAKKVGRPKCEEIWDKLSLADQQAAVAGIAPYIAHEPRAKYRKDPERYLRDEIWLNEWPKSERVATGSATPTRTAPRTTTVIPD